MPEPELPTSGFRVSNGRPGAGPRLRVWQQEALQKFEEGDKASFLAVATPGAGKTTFALTAARRALLARRARRLVVVVPTQHLKQQWAHAAERLGLHLDPDWSPGYGAPALRRARHRRHLSAGGVQPARAARPGARGASSCSTRSTTPARAAAWGDAVRTRSSTPRRRLCLSGTPFRSDQMHDPLRHLRRASWPSPTSSTATATR